MSAMKAKDGLVAALENKGWHVQPSTVDRLLGLPERFEDEDLSRDGLLHLMMDLLLQYAGHDRIEELEEEIKLLRLEVVWQSAQLDTVGRPAVDEVMGWARHVVGGTITRAGDKREVVIEFTTRHPMICRSLNVVGSAGALVDTIWCNRTRVFHSESGVSTELWREDALKGLRIPAASLMRVHGQLWGKGDMLSVAVDGHQPTRVTLPLAPGDEAEAEHAESTRPGARSNAQAPR